MAEFTSEKTVIDLQCPDRATVPLFVDLDGTLIRTDTLWETALLLLAKQPWSIFALLGNATRGRSRLKYYLAERVPIRPETLPYHVEFLEWLKREKEAGRTLILATAANEIIAQSVADHVKIFDRILASNAEINLKGAQKLAHILKTGSTFAYAGDSHADRAIWDKAHCVVLVGAPSRLSLELRQTGRVWIEFPRLRPSLRSWAKAIRLHQWSKNLLVFVPILASHRALDLVALRSSLYIFVAFGCLASGTYLLNDLLDLTSDRQHPTKRYRPMARGEFSIPSAIMLAVVLIFAAIAMACLDGEAGLTAVAAYFAVSLAYSLYLKRLLLIDVFILAGLYTLRIIAGGMVTGIAVSAWMMSFSVFVFLSLGFNKRAVELLRRSERDGESASSRRAYLPADFTQINQFGIASGFIASLVLALYIGSDQVRLLYSEPNWLWFIIPLFVYWISRVWLMAGRGILGEDPIAFALKDRTTWVVCLCCAMVAYLATAGFEITFMK